MLFILSTYLLTLGMGIITFGTILKDFGNAGYKLNQNFNQESDPKTKLLMKELFFKPVINVLGIMGISLVYVANKDDMLYTFERIGLLTEMTPEEIEKYNSTTSTLEKLDIITKIENDKINQDICTNTYTIDFGNNNIINVKVNVTIKENKFNLIIQDLEVTNKMLPEDLINYILNFEILSKTNLKKNNKHINIKSEHFNFYISTYLLMKLRDLELEEKSNQEKLNELKNLKNILENCRDNNNNDYDEEFKQIEKIITKESNSIIDNNPSLETTNDDEAKLSLTQKNTRNQ